jgi:hypothetical protein
MSNPADTKYMLIRERENDGQQRELTNAEKRLLELRMAVSKIDMYIPKTDAEHQTDRQRICALLTEFTAVWEKARPSAVESSEEEEGNADEEEEMVDEKEESPDGEGDTASFIQRIQESVPGMQTGVQRDSTPYRR